MQRHSLGRFSKIGPLPDWPAIAWYFALVAVLGIYLPWRLGFEFLDSLTLLLYGCLSALFAATLIAYSVAAQRARPLLETPPEGGIDRAILYRKVAAATVASWGAAVLVLAVALLTVNVREWHGRVLLPPAGLLASLLLFSFSLALAVATAGARVARAAPSARAAAGALRFRVLIPFLVYFLVSWFLPGEWKGYIDAQLTPERLTRNLCGAAALLAVLSARQLQSAPSSRSHLPR